VKKGTREEVGGSISQALRELCAELAVKAEAGIKVSVGPFIYWRTFDDGLRRICNDIWRTLETDFRQLDFLPRISNLRLAEDGVHLQEKSANKYIEHVVGESLAQWLREGGDSEMEEAGGTSDSQELDNTMVNTQSTPATSRPFFKPSANEVVSGVAQLRNEFRSFKRTTEERFHRDLLAFARHEEALDTAKK